MSLEINAYDTNLKDKIFLDGRIYEIVLIRKMLQESLVSLGLKLLGSHSGELPRFIEHDFNFMDKINKIEEQ